MYERKIIPKFNPAKPRPRLISIEDSKSGDSLDINTLRKGALVGLDAGHCILDMFTHGIEIDKVDKIFVDDLTYKHWGVKLGRLRATLWRRDKEGIVQLAQQLWDAGKIKPVDMLVYEANHAQRTKLQYDSNKPWLLNKDYVQVLEDNGLIEQPNRFTDFVVRARERLRRVFE